MHIAYIYDPMGILSSICALKYAVEYSNTVVLLEYAYTVFGTSGIDSGD